MDVQGTTIDRYEYKYRIPPALVSDVGRWLRQFCVLDPKANDGSYLISSLYFDSPRRALYRQGEAKAPKRLKLRVRRYTGGPYFLEVKRRYKRIVLKSRVDFDPRWWPAILHDPTVPERAGLTGRARERVDFFLAWYLRLHAEPVVVIRYRREAYVSRVDEYARVTFDTHLEARPAATYEIPIADGAGWIPLDDAVTCGLPVSGGILELKCPTEVPVWMTDLAGEFGLQARGFSKYARGLQAVERFPRSLRVGGRAGFGRGGMRWWI